jgi:hypothetical protein
LRPENDLSPDDPPIPPRLRDGVPLRRCYQDPDLFAAEAPGPFDFINEDLELSAGGSILSDILDNSRPPDPCSHRFSDEIRPFAFETLQTCGIQALDIVRRRMRYDLVKLCDTSPQMAISDPIWQILIWRLSELNSGALASHQRSPRNSVLALIHDVYSHAMLAFVRRVLR